jgi:hypothetical protein
LQAITTSGGGGGSTAAARNHRGEAGSIPAGAIATLTSFTSEDYKLRGFVAYGTTDFVAWVEVDGVPLDGISARGSVSKVAQIILPNPETYASSSSIVALRIRNDNAYSVTGDFEGTLLGE